MNEEPIRDSAIERSLPHNSAAEKEVLGNILIDNALIAEAMELLEYDQFYVPGYRKTLKAMIALFMMDKEISPAMLSEELAKTNELESMGGMPFLLGLMDGVSPVVSLEDLASVIRSNAMLRGLIREAHRIAADALEHEDEPQAILERAGKGIFKITLENTVKTFGQIGPLAHKSLAKAHVIQQQGTAITGLSTGFNELDAITLGLQRTDIVIGAARPSMGKTALAVMVAQHAAVDLQALVAFFSLEMSEEQITNRVLCARARVDSQLYRSGHLSPQEWDRLHTVEQELANAKLFIDDTPGISTLRIKAKCRRLTSEHGMLDLVVIDYIQLVGNDGSRTHFSREQEVSQISKDLKGMAKELNVPILVLSQLSRKPEDRTDHRPQLADLRESGSIEQDADLVAFIYREDKYKSHTDQTSAPTNIAEIILAKQRNGPTGTAALRFDSPTGRFDNLYSDHNHN